MTPAKSAASRKSEFRALHSDNFVRSDALKSKRIAHEEAQKAAGLWGEMSVGYLEREGAAFVHQWKGATPADVYKLAVKRPKEIIKPEHEVLCTWLKAAVMRVSSRRSSPGMSAPTKPPASGSNSSATLPPRAPGW